MKQEEIHWADWHRLLLGTAPLEFLLEVFIRTIIIYFFLLLILRLLGKRMGGQLTISELSVMLTLGAIVSVPMQIPDKGLLQGMLVLVCALAFQRGTNYLAVKFLKIERITQGHADLLVKNGVLLSDQLSALRISKEQMHAVLRNEKIYNLGEVQRVYIEACGIFSIFKHTTPQPGLALLPPGDESAMTRFRIFPDITVCERCGTLAHNINKNSTCNNCSSSSWTVAVLTKKP